MDNVLYKITMGLTVVGKANTKIFMLLLKYYFFGTISNMTGVPSVNSYAIPSVCSSEYAKCM